MPPPARQDAPALSPGGVATLFTEGRATALSLTLQLLEAQEIGTVAGVQETWRLQLSDGVHSCRVTLARALAPVARALTPHALVLVTAAACRQDEGRRFVMVTDLRAVRFEAGVIGDPQPFDDTVSVAAALPPAPPAPPPVVTAALPPGGAGRSLEAVYWDEAGRTLQRLHELGKCKRALLDKMARVRETAAPASLPTELMALQKEHDEIVTLEAKASVDSRRLMRSARHAELHGAPSPLLPHEARARAAMLHAHATAVLQACDAPLTEAEKVSVWALRAQAALADIEVAEAEAAAEAESASRAAPAGAARGRSTPSAPASLPASTLNAAVWPALRAAQAASNLLAEEAAEREAAEQRRAKAKAKKARRKQAARSAAGAPADAEEEEEEQDGGSVASAEPPDALSLPPAEEPLPRPPSPVAVAAPPLPLPLPMPSPVAAPRRYAPPTAPPSGYVASTSSSLLPPALPPLPQPLPIDSVFPPLLPPPSPAPPPVAAVEEPPPPPRRECCICFCDTTLPEMVVLYKCGHRCLCPGCAAMLLAAGRPCPKCRALFEGFMLVYDD